MPADSPETVLATRTLELVDIPSPSREESGVYRYVKRNIEAPPLYDNGESLLYARRSGRPLVLLAGHTDTVPADGNVPGRIENGTVFGRGASDMKGGLAVMMELESWAADAELAYDLGLLFFPREELGPDDNPLPAVFAAAPAIDEAVLVICLEPTDNTLQLGCLGNITAHVSSRAAPRTRRARGSASTRSRSPWRGSARSSSSSRSTWTSTGSCSGKLRRSPRSMTSATPTT